VATLVLLASHDTSAAAWSVSSRFKSKIVRIMPPGFFRMEARELLVELGARAPSRRSGRAAAAELPDIRDFLF
jgi:hypothetical protein